MFYATKSTREYNLLSIKQQFTIFWEEFHNFAFCSRPRYRAMKAFKSIVSAMGHHAVRNIHCKKPSVHTTLIGVSFDTVEC